ncbi:hypothetical protein KCP73_17755 [Salmonella enterica subsp. enterica]|nr:hypothetical protein KCP73_17755 [Salmonella enterica subsp. enterica]
MISICLNDRLFGHHRLACDAGPLGEQQHDDRLRAVATFNNRRRASARVTARFVIVKRRCAGAHRVAASGSLPLRTGVARGTCAAGN